MSLLLLLSRQGATATTVALIGQGFAYAQGAPVVQLSCAPSGQVVSVGQGALGSKVSSGVMGQSFGLDQGTPTLSVNSPVVGQSFGISQGVFSKDQSAALVGLGYSYSTGEVGARLGVELYGQSIPFELGTLTVPTPAKKGVSVYTRPESVFAVSGAERIDVVINPVYAYVETQVDRVDVYRAPLKTAA